MYWVINRQLILKKKNKEQKQTVDLRTFIIKTCTFDFYLVTLKFARFAFIRVFLHRYFHSSTECKCFWHLWQTICQYGSSVWSYIFWHCYIDIDCWQRWNLWPPNHRFTSNWSPGLNRARPLDSSPSAHHNPVRAWKQRHKGSLLFACLFL